MGFDAEFMISSTLAGRSRKTSANPHSTGASILDFRGKNF
jgi:hypothetical protein